MIRAIKTFLRSPKIMLGEIGGIALVGVVGATVLGALLPQFPALRGSRCVCLA